MRNIPVKKVAVMGVPAFTLALPSQQTILLMEIACASDVLALIRKSGLFFLDYYIHPLPKVIHPLSNKHSSVTRKSFIHLTIHPSGLRPLHQPEALGRLSLALAGSPSFASVVPVVS